MINALLRLGFIASFGLVTTIAQAAPMTFNFSGSVTTVFNDDSANIFSSNFNSGDAVSGSWTIDTDSVANTTGLDYMQYYDTSFTATVGAHTFSGDAQYRIFNDFDGGGDGFSVVNESGTYSVPSAFSGLRARTFFIQLLGMPATTLTDFSQITNPDAIYSSATAYVPNGLRLDSETDGSYGALYFSVDEISKSVAVSEPGTLALLGLGITGLLLGKRRKLA